MDFTEQLKLLKDAQGDPAKLALASVDLAFPELPENKRVAIKQSLEAAAIPHWCDEDILAALLEDSQPNYADLLVCLQDLNVVEQFPARGSTALNVHEATRLALRRQMASDEKDKFRALSIQAAAYFADELNPAARIEWIYHLLCGNPELGADELEKVGREWFSTARPEDCLALAAALMELHDSGLLEGRALLWVLLFMTWTRVSRGETAQLAGMTTKILKLAQSVGDLSGEADTQALRGDVLQAQGNLAAAQAAFEEYLAISRRLAEQDPGNAGWQRELGVAHSRVGDVLQAQGNLAAAQAAFEKDLAISRRLAEQDPGNAGWQQGLGVAHSRVGGVLQAQGNLAAAQAAFEENLAISRRLAEQDPGKTRGGNRDWEWRTAGWVMCCRRKAIWRPRKQPLKRIWRSAAGWQSRTPAKRGVATGIGSGAQPGG